MRYIIILTCILAPIASCTEDEQILKEETIEGPWSLVFVSCECQPVDLEPGEHIWNFDLTDDKLTVINHVAEELHTILETGDYSITITEDKVTLLSVSYDYYFEDGFLFLSDHPEADGPLIKFVRN